MADISVRNLDDDVAAGLKVRAAEHGRSMEAEARSILTAAILGENGGRNLGQAIRERFATLGDVELAIPARIDRPRAPDFSTNP